VSCLFYFLLPRFFKEKKENFYGGFIVFVQMGFFKKTVFLGCFFLQNPACIGIIYYCEAYFANKCKEVVIK